MKLVPHIKLWISAPDRGDVVGSGRCRLLRAIERMGSLSAAAEELGISYRKAWGDLKRAERHIGRKLIVKSRGGAGGGKTELTPEGRKLLEAYTGFKEDVEMYAMDSYERWIKGIFDDCD